MEIFKNTNYDFLGKKMLFIGISLVLTAAGLVSLVAKGGPRYGIDFKGGTKMYIKFQQTPDEEKLRSVLASALAGEVTVQRIVGTNEVIVDTELKSDDELQAVRDKVNKALQTSFGQPGGKPDFHALGRDAVAQRLTVPLQQAGISMSTEDISGLAGRLVDFRDKDRSGLLTSLDQVSGVQGVTPQVAGIVKNEFSLSSFVVRSFEQVGPKIGAELRQQAINATLLALLGMLAYIWFRFEFVYGLAAVLAVFHDTLMTIGLFSIFDKEISLPVVAALLTLVGYSMNDTIVIFDRVRENLSHKAKQSLESVINMSVNQTMSRTVMASGLTFLSVLALWLLGPDTLNGFAFCLVVGILVGTYSSVFIASPIVIWWNNWRGGAELVAPATVAAARVSAPSVATAGAGAAKAAPRDKGTDKARAGR
jgi:preprotein translocase subunit SecF